MKLVLFMQQWLEPRTVIKQGIWGHQIKAYWSCPTSVDYPIHLTSTVTQEPEMQTSGGQKWQWRVIDLWTVIHGNMACLWPTLVKVGDHTLDHPKNTGNP